MMRSNRRDDITALAKFAAAGILLLAAAALLDGCAGLIRPARQDPAALQRIASWSGNNAGLTQFKGIMQVNIQANGRNIRGRAAFAGALPDRLRLEFLTPLGQSLLILAGDGRTVTLIEIPQNKVQHLAQDGEALQKLVGLPVGIADLIDVLIGRPPLPRYAAATSGEGASACAVELRTRWHRLAADLQARDCGRPDLMRVYDSQEHVDYTVQWQRWQTIDGFEVPRAIEITTGQGASIALVIERLWPVSSLDPSIFEPGSPDAAVTGSRP